MKRPLVWTVLAVALVAPSAGLAWLGIAALRGETARASERWRERAEAIVQAVEREIRAQLRELGDGQAGAIAFAVPDETAVAASDSIATSAARDPRDPELLRALGAEVDRLQSEGELETALARLREVATRADDPPLAAWALDAYAALLASAGRTEEARAAWRELAGEFPDETDPRGIPRGFVARFRLAEAGDARAEELLELARDVSESRRSHAEIALGAFAARVRAELADAAAQNAELAPALAELDISEAEHARRLRFESIVAIDGWVAGLGGEAARVFAPDPDPLDPAAAATAMVVALRSEGDGRFRGGAEDVPAFCARVLASAEATSWPALGFAVELRDARGVRLASVGAVPAEQRRESTLVQLLAPPFEAYEVAVHGTDFGAFVAAERQRLWWLAAVLFSALAVALGAAFTTVRALRREAAAAAQREAFVAAVTHELKAPLAAIRLFGELLEQGGVEESKVREFAGRTVQESERLSRLVDSVLELARIEQGGALAARFETLDLGDVARRAVASFEPLARGQGFAIELDVPDGPVTVRGDRDALEGALLNLLDNAVKYSESSTPPADPLRVTLSRLTAGQAELAVLDRGRGVPSGDAQRIFEPFVRSGDELVRDRPGVGLGLALVQRVAAAHGGRATYAPREGGGSRFAIELPEARA